MGMSSGSDDGEPMGEMNTTPLIDVMLVLLVMFIITIPIQTHAVKIDLPTNAASSAPVNPVVNDLVVRADGGIMWNGQPVNMAEVEDLLNKSATMKPEPELHVAPDPQASFARVDEVFAAIKRSGVTKLGFVGNDNYKDWAAASTAN